MMCCPQTYEIRSKYVFSRYALEMITIKNDPNYKIIWYKNVYCGQQNISCSVE